MELGRINCWYAILKVSLLGNPQYPRQGFNVFFKAGIVLVRVKRLGCCQNVGNVSRFGIDNGINHVIAQILRVEELLEPIQEECVYLTSIVQNVKFRRQSLSCQCFCKFISHPHYRQMPAARNNNPYDPISLSPQCIWVIGAAWNHINGKEADDAVQLVGNCQNRADLACWQLAFSRDWHIVFLNGCSDVSFFTKQLGIDLTHDPLQLSKFTHHLRRQVKLVDVSSSIKVCQLFITKVQLLTKQLGQDRRPLHLVIHGADLVMEADLL